ncbi:MAG: glutaredoxin 3 [Myxococcota bacterium]|jgi:glutaredoxin 3
MRATLVGFTVCVALSAALAGCSESRTPAPRVVAAAAPAAITVDGPRADLLLRFIDPESGAVATALTVADIPAAARGRVVVYDAVSPPPAGWDHVADLRQGLPAVTVPTRDFAFTVTSSASASTSATGKTKTVAMFSTQGCGYCKKARKFFAKQRVPFTEYDLERDPKASGKLAQMGKKAGVPQSQLQGVPIIFVDGRAMVGFDQRRLTSLLGI